MCCTLIVHLCLCLPYIEHSEDLYKKKSTMLDRRDTLYHLNDKVGLYLIHLNLGLLDAPVA